MSNKFNPYAEAHASPKGAGDARPTAFQVLRDNDVLKKWTGKVAVVTGATSGIGIETARALHATGADVYITARNTKKAQDVIDDILGSSEGGGKLEVIEMDLDSLDSVKQAGQRLLATTSKINILVNNAGIMATPEGSKTKDGFEQQFGVNHLAHFTFTALLIPTLLRSSTPSFNSRVVNVSSAAHQHSSVHFDDINITKDYNPWIGYGQSKTANIWTANYIDRVYGPRGLHANSLHPGVILTNLSQYLPPGTVEKWEEDKAFMDVFLSIEQGAATTIWAATGSAWEGKGGKYLAKCAVGEPMKEAGSMTDSGFAPHAYNEEGENKLWKLSLELTGVKVEE